MPTILSSSSYESLSSNSISFSRLFHVHVHHINRSNHRSLQAWNMELNVELHTAFPKFTTFQSIECWHDELGIEFLSKIPSTHKCKCTPTLHHIVLFRDAK